MLFALATYFMLITSAKSCTSIKLGEIATWHVLRFCKMLQSHRNPGKIKASEKTLKKSYILSYSYHFWYVPSCSHQLILVEGGFVPSSPPPTFMMYHPSKPSFLQLWLPPLHSIEKGWGYAGGHIPSAVFPDSHLDSSLLWLRCMGMAVRKAANLSCVSFWQIQQSTKSITY